MNERISTAPWTAASIRVVTCGGARNRAWRAVIPGWTQRVTVEAGFTGGHLLHLALHLAAAGCVLDDLYREAAAPGIELSPVRATAPGPAGRRAAAAAVRPGA